MGSALPEVTPAGDAVTPRKIEGREFKKLGYKLFVWLSKDKVECRCSYVPQQQGAMMTAEELKGYLAQSGVREGIIPEALSDFATRAADRQTLVMVLIAAGISPEHGIDGSVEYSAPSSTVVSSKCDESACVDMHQVQTFINVMPGDEIGRILPATTGCPGKSVTGQLIPQQPGKPLKLKIGNNIRLEENGTLMIAKAAGRVCNAKGEISVAEEYIVMGDVNFKIGSIDFNGFVEVRGDVLDGFSITAAKGMRINGIIGACEIRSDGDIVFCGMSGQKKGTIVCGGSITANYIHETDVECAGNLKLDVELLNSQVKVLGRVVVNKGAISGGSCIALGGIETNKAGSPASIPTELYAGIHYNDKEEYEQLLGELEKNGLQASRTRDPSEADELKKARTALMERVLALRNKSDERANPKINIKKLLYDNTLLCAGLTVREKVDERKGPISVIENSIDGGLRFLAMTGLDIKASVLEEAYAREYEMMYRITT